MTANRQVFWRPMDCDEAHGEQVHSFRVLPCRTRSLLGLAQAFQHSLLIFVEPLAYGSNRQKRGIGHSAQPFGKLPQGFAARHVYPKSQVIWRVRIARLQPASHGIVGILNA